MRVSTSVKWPLAFATNYYCYYNSGRRSSCTGTGKDQSLLPPVRLSIDFGATILAQARNNTYLGVVDDLGYCGCGDRRPINALIARVGLQSPRHTTPWWLLFMLLLGHCRPRCSARGGLWCFKCSLMVRPLCSAGFVTFSSRYSHCNPKPRAQAKPGASLFGASLAVPLDVVALAMDDGLCKAPLGRTACT